MADDVRPATDEEVEILRHCQPGVNFYSFPVCSVDKMHLDGLLARLDAAEQRVKELELLQKPWTEILGKKPLPAPPE